MTLSGRRARLFRDLNCARDAALQALRLDDVLKRVQPQSHDPAVCVYLCSTNVSYVLRNEGYIKILLLEHHVLDDDEGQSGSRPPSI